MEPKAIHSVLVAEAEKQDLPKHYRDDLVVHDLAILADHKTQRFLWVLRECGTHLIPLDMETENERRIQRSWQLAVVNNFGSRALFYSFKNGKLKPITAEDAKRID